MSKNLARAAEILGVTEESVAVFSDEIKNSMTAAVELIGDKTEQQAAEAYAELERLWLTGVLDSAMGEVADNTGISKKTLRSLPDSVQQEIYFTFTLDRGDIDGIYGVMNKALSVAELPEVARVLEMPVTDLESLPREKQERLCGAYSMLYGDKELIGELKAIIGGDV